MTSWDRDAFMRQYYETLAQQWAAEVDRIVFRASAAIKSAPHAAWCGARPGCTYTPCTCLKAGVL